MFVGVVYSNDKFEYEKGSEPKLKHIPAMGSRGDMVGVYALARIANTQPMFEFMPKNEIDAIMIRAKSSNIGESDYEAMARETAIRRLFKYLPMSDQIEYAVAT